MFILNSMASTWTGCKICFNNFLSPIGSSVIHYPSWLDIRGRPDSVNTEITLPSGTLLLVNLTVGKP